MTVTTVGMLYEEISRLKAELNEAICIIDEQRKTFERLLAEKADAQKSADLLRQFTKWADQGYCPALVFDDNGHWAVSFEGIQTLTIGDDTQDVATLTLPSLNKRICALHQNVCLFRGEGYFYFVYDDGVKYFDKSVPVYRVNHLSLDRWLAEAEDFVNGLKQARLIP